MGGIPMNRREFSTLLSGLLAVPGLMAEGKEAPAVLEKIVSGQYRPGSPTAPPSAVHISHKYLLGMLPGSIRLEVHDSILAPGAPPEPVGHHKHSEIWFIREGEATLMTAGITRTLKRGDIGICVAGDAHYIANASKINPVSYLVLAVGPPE
jgi:uncharacterized cupin superfamily protein